MGTPEFAAGILEALLELPFIEVIGVVSQPDKKVGRKQTIAFTPVKKLALAHGLPVFQPVSIRTDYSELLNWHPDLVITCAYGQFVPKEVLYAFEYPCLNVHASLLPKYRGGAPIHKAIIAGETVTGVTLMQMIEKMDAGKMYAKAAVEIGPDETTESLHDRLMAAGAALVKEKLEAFLNHELSGEIQDETQVSYAWNISRQEEWIDCARSAQVVYNQIRGLISWPVGHIVVNGKKIKIWSCRRSELDAEAEPGTLVLKGKHLLLKCLDGCLEIKELQLEGKNRCPAESFINGGKSYFIIEENKPC